MAKLPAFFFYPRDWLTDANLRRCTPLARSVWIDLLCIMWECDIRGVLSTDGEPWTDDEIAKAVPGDTYQNMLALQELLRNRVAKRNDIGSVYSKRMVEDEKVRDQWRKRQARKRDVTADVTPMSRRSSSSSSSSNTEKQRRKIDGSAAAFSSIGFDSPFGQIEFQVVWIKHFLASQENNTWVTGAMEQAIQECQDQGIGVPPQFYQAKRTVEENENQDFARGVKKK